jgi:hypothetical protein
MLSNKSACRLVLLLMAFTAAGQRRADGRVGPVHLAPLPPPPPHRTAGLLSACATPWSASLEHAWSSWEGGEGGASHRWVPSGGGGWQVSLTWVDQDRAAMRQHGWLPPARARGGSPSWSLVHRNVTNVLGFWSQFLGMVMACMSCCLQDAWWLDVSGASPLLPGGDLLGDPVSTTPPRIPSLTSQQQPPGTPSLLANHSRNPSHASAAGRAAAGSGNQGAAAADLLLSDDADEGLMEAGEADAARWGSQVVIQ